MNGFETVDNIEAYNNLAEAIVTLACEDYRSYRKQLRKATARLENVLDKMSMTSEEETAKMEQLAREKHDVELNIRLLNSKILEIEKFLPSPYGMMLSHQLGDVILEKLRNE